MVRGANSNRRSGSIVGARGCLGGRCRCAGERCGWWCDAESLAYAVEGVSLLVAGDGVVDFGVGESRCSSMVAPLVRRMDRMLPVASCQSVVSWRPQTLVFRARDTVPTKFPTRFRASLRKRTPATSTS